MTLYDASTWDNSEYAEVPKEPIDTSDIANINPEIQGTNQDEVNVNVKNGLAGKIDISALNDYLPKLEKGQAGGVAPLNSEGKIDEQYLPPLASVSPKFDTSLVVRMTSKGVFYPIVMPKLLSSYHSWELWCYYQDTANLTVFRRTLIAKPEISSNSRARNIADFTTNTYDSTVAGSYVNVQFETRGIPSSTNTSSFELAYQSSSSNSFPDSGSYQGLYVYFRGYY